MFDLLQHQGDRQAEEETTQDNVNGIPNGEVVSTVMSEQILVSKN